MHQLDIEYAGLTVVPDLHQRLRRELLDAQSFAPMVGLVGVIAHKPHCKQLRRTHFRGSTPVKSAVAAKLIIRQHGRKRKRDPNGRH